MKRKLERIFLTMGFLVLAFTTTAQQIELGPDAKEKAFHLDSIGNLIDYKEALKLLKTGSYISIPKMNELNELEFLIRKKDANNPMDDEHQVYTGGKMVVTTKGIAKFKSPLSMGEYIPELCAINLFETLCLEPGSKSDKSSVLIYTNKKSWSSVRSLTNTFVKQNPQINFIIIQPDRNAKISDYFTKGFLKRNSHVFFGEDLNKAFLIGDQSYPAYHLVNKSGKIEMMLPPMPMAEVAQNAIQKYLDR